MGVPTKHNSNSKAHRREVNHKIGVPGLAACSACKKQTPPHRACQWCGAYRGRAVVSQKQKKEKK